MARSAYQLEVTLRGTRPPIWRRLEVSSGLTFLEWHVALQAAIGWTDSHLHAFIADGVEYGPPDPEWGTAVEDASRVRLARVLRAAKDRLVYQYDFGDDRSTWWCSRRSYRSMPSGIAPPW